MTINSENMTTGRNGNISLIRLAFLMMTIFLGYSCDRNGAHYDASGTFETTEIIVSAETSGKIISLDIQEGEEVKENQVLGIIDTVQLYLSKLKLQTNVKAVENRKTDVKMQISLLEAQLATAKIEKQRIENLLKANAANRKQLDDIDAQITLLEKEIEVQSSSMQRGNASIHNESTALEIQIEQMEDQLEKCYIRSPIDGTVLVKYAEKGEMAAPGKALMKVADTREMILRAYITADQFTRVKVGQEANVYADFGTKETREYKGIVSWVSEKAEFTPKTVQTRDERDNLVYAVKIRVKNDGFLKIGMYGNINF